MYKGIDVSSYQGTIDWQKAAAAGVDFAILKVIRRDSNPDKRFEENWAGCEAAGMTIQGVYNYSYATTTEKARQDAARVLEILGSDRYPMVWLDVEDDSQKGLGRKLVDIINAYGAVIAGGGCKFGVYTGLSFYNSYIRPYAAELDCPFWIARYLSGDKTVNFSAAPNADKKPNILHDMYGWQFSSAGRVPGITGSVDLNIWYAELEAGTVGVPEEKTPYQLSDFIRESRPIWEVGATAPAAEIVSKTVTVSTDKNRSHAIVTPLERYLKALGYYTGTVEADAGKNPVFGPSMHKATILYQRHNVGATPRNQDGVWTAGAASWKTIYGVK